MALTSPSLCVTRERSSGPSLTAGSVVPSAQAVIRPPPTPSRPAVHFPGSAGYRTPRSDSTNRRPSGRGGSPQFPPPPSERSTPSTPESSSGLRFQDLHPFHGLRRDGLGSALPIPHPKAGTLTARQASLDAADRSVAPPKGLSTLGFDPTRFQTEPPACYRASWQLPGPDSHRQATTSLCQITIYIIDLQLWAHSATV